MRNNNRLVINKGALLMKLKLLVKFFEKVLGTADTGNAPRADMYLPERLLAMALVYLAGGTVFAILFVIMGIRWMLAVAVGGAVLGIAALLCWKNQAIRMISEEEFEYTTMFGNTHRYAFRDITGLRQNQDSLTLLVGKNKIHIESMAVISRRLADRIDRALEQKA